MGSEYLGGTTAIWLLVLSAIPGAYAYANSQVLASHGRMWISAVMLAVWAISLVILTAVLVPRWHGEGLALADLIAQILYAVIQAWSLRKLPNQEPS